MDLPNKLSKKKTVTSVLPQSKSLPKNANGALGRFIFMDFCQPAKIYLIIALLTLIYYVSTDQDFIWIVLKAILFIAWGFSVNKLCTMDFKAIAWIAALIPPFVFLFFTIKVPPATANAPKSNQPQ